MPLFFEMTDEKLKKEELALAAHLMSIRCGKAGCV